MYFWGLVKKVVQQVEDLSFFYFFLLFYKKVKKSEKKYKKVFSTFPNVDRTSVDSVTTKVSSHTLACTCSRCSCNLVSDLLVSSTLWSPSTRSLHMGLYKSVPINVSSPHFLHA